MDPTIQVNIREYNLMNFTIKLLQIILHKKNVRVQNRVPWATAWSAALGYSTNDQ